MAPKWVYLFDELDIASERCGGEWEDVRGLLGGKGANLADMTRLGIPVPPGFTITSEACNAYLRANGLLPTELPDQIAEALASIERATGRRLGDPANPLLVSCRSGAKFSMPGMMDTVLNIGLNDDIVAAMTGRGDDPRPVLDSYRRLIQMFGTVVQGIPDEPFQETLTDARRSGGVASDSELSTDHLEAIVKRFMMILRERTGNALPPDPMTQLSMATEAVFKSWNGRRARDYRAASGISDDLGTAVNIQTMVFGNSGPNSATGVAVSRSATTGEPRLEGDFLINAQGEDVVAGIRETSSIEELRTAMPDQYEQLAAFARQLELHFKDMQDIEFTIDNGTLWMLQTRNGKRTAQAAVRIAVDLASEGTITRNEALQRVAPEQVEFFLHPQFDTDAKRRALDGGTYLTTGLNVSPGAAVGIIALDADLAEAWARDRHQSVILVRPETKPDDVHGMLAAEGVLTSSGGRTSHAALVARQFGRPAVVGASEVQVDLGERTITVGRQIINEGESISIDGTTGEVFLGSIETRVPDIDDVWLMELLDWADDVRRLGVWANAD
ncbi:MAG: pyruvate, phosphate dikinase, partial [Proteobacteria bacterium]|nr:pyruvate, phosphate dikinase [Pseudomonadota bacterium]